MQAKSTINESYTSKIKKYYKTKVEDNVSHLERLKNFDVKFSILEFFKFTSTFITRNGFISRTGATKMHTLGGTLPPLRNIKIAS